MATKTKKTKEPVKDWDMIKLYNGEEPQQVSGLKFPGWYEIDKSKHLPLPGDALVIKQDKNDMLEPVVLKPGRSIANKYTNPYRGDSESPHTMFNIWSDISLATGGQPVKWSSYLNRIKELSLTTPLKRNSFLFRRRRPIVPDSLLGKSSKSIVWLLQPEDVIIKGLDVLANFYLEDDMGEPRKVVKYDSMNTLGGDRCTLTMAPNDELVGLSQNLALLNLHKFCWGSRIYVYRAHLVDPYGIAKRIPLNRIFSEPSPLP